MREQLLDAHAGRLDAVLITHDHADQLHGIDDLRAIVYGMRQRLDVYSDQATIAGVRQRFGYCFDTPAGSDYPPILNARIIAEPFETFVVEGAGGPIEVSTFAQQHGRIRSLGFRFGPIAYSSDVNGLSEDAFAALEGADLLDCRRVAACRPIRPMPMWRRRWNGSPASNLGAPS
jgi:phosphoribosyl 1,2-cyclic phosphate phosphodiesterase